LLKAPEMPEPMDPAKENSLSLQMQLLNAFPDQDHDAHIQAHTIFMQTRMVQINPQVYALLQSHVSDHISMKASLEVQAAIQQNAELQQMAQADPQAFQTVFNSMIAKKTVEITAQLAQAEMQAGQAQQDPLVRLKQQEIDLRALDLQRKTQEAQMKEVGQFNRQENDIAFQMERLQSQEEASDKRLQVAKEKLNIMREKNVQKS